MKEQIEALRQLQEQDQKMVKIELHLAAIPRRLETMDRDLKQLEAMLTREQRKLEQSREFRQRQERQLEDEKEQLVRSKKRLTEVKNAREHGAIQREIDATRKLSDTRAAEIENIQTAITEAEQRIEKTTESLSALRTQFGDEREKLAERKTKLETARSAYLEQRSSMTQGIPSRLLANYDRMRRRTPRDALVPVRQRRCGGCKIQVPHQTYVALKRAEIIPNCEACGRLQYWAGLFSQEFEVDPAESGIVPEADSKKKSTRKKSTKKKKTSAKSVITEEGETAEGKKRLRVAPKKKRASKKKKGEEEVIPSRPLSLSPKMAPEKVIPDHMALDDDAAPKPKLGPNSAPKPAPAPKTVAAPRDEEAEDAPSESSVEP